MKKLLFILLITIPFLLSAQVRFIAPDGDDDTGDGTISNPWATLQKGVDETHAGDTLWIRGGKYMSLIRTRIDTTLGVGGHSGTPTKPILIAGYINDVTDYSDTTWTYFEGDSTYILGNLPVFDCRWQCDSNWAAYNSWLAMTEVQYITLKDIVVNHVLQCEGNLSGAISAVRSANLTFENLYVHNISERGFWYTSGAWSYADSTNSVERYGNTPEGARPRYPQPDTTKWINCDVWNICDTLGNGIPGNEGNGGDAWKVVSYNGNHLKWEGCRAWNYSDDGFDPNHGIREFINVWVMASDKYSGFHNEGNGLKLTALRAETFDWYTYADSVKHRNDSMFRAKYCLGIFCTNVAFYSGVESQWTLNGRLSNNTAYRCGTGYINITDTNNIGDYYRNNLVVYSTRGDAIKKREVQFHFSNPLYEADSNTWIRNPSSYFGFDYNPAYTVDSNDFQVTDSLILVELFTAPRLPGGALPEKPLKLASNSDLVDMGIDGYWVDTYNGSAPDVGYYETGSDTIPVANFFTDNTLVCKEDSVQFTDVTTNNPLTWAWSFPGGSPDTSNLQNPKIEYPTPGVYSVTLYVTNADSNDTEIKLNYIIVRDSVVTDFSASETNVQTGTNISFSDLTTNNPASWSWTFEGGTPDVSNLQNPVIQYNTAGVYSVTLETTNTCNTDTEQKVGYITVTNPYVPPLAPSSPYNLIIISRQ